MEAAAVRLYFLLEHNYSLVIYNIMYIAYNLDMTYIYALKTKLISAKTILREGYAL